MRAPRRSFASLGLAGLLLTAGAIATWSAAPNDRSSDGGPAPSMPGTARGPIGPTVPSFGTPSSAPADGCDAEIGDLTSADIRETTTRAGPHAIICFPAGDVDERVVASVEGQVWRLDRDTVLRRQLRIEAPGVVIVGGRVEVPSDDPWAEGVVILADDVTIEGVTFRSGGLGVSVRGRDRASIVGNDFADLAGTAIAVWGEGRGADDVIVEDNRIVQTRSRRASPIMSRATDDISSGIRNTGLIVRGNDIDQGQGDVGWYGIELKASPGALVEGNDVRGGSVLVSLPDSDDVIVRGNRLDLRGSPYWGIELPLSHGATIAENVIVGDGPDGNESAVSMNTGSERATIRQNVVEAVRTLVDLSGDHHEIADNCVTDVRLEYEYRSSAGSDVRFERNGPCEAVPQ